MGKAERKVEDYLIEQIELLGGVCEKHTSPGRRGVPDELVTWPTGFMELIETKASRGVMKSWQDRDHKRRIAMKVQVWALYTREAVDRYIAIRRKNLPTVNLWPV